MIWSPLFPPRKPGQNQALVSTSRPVFPLDEASPAALGECAESAVASSCASFNAGSPVFGQPGELLVQRKRVRQLQASLRAGMAARAAVNTAGHRVISFFLSPLLQSVQGVQRSLRERLP